MLGSWWGNTQKSVVDMREKMRGHLETRDRSALETRCGRQYRYWVLAQYLVLMQQRKPAHPAKVTECPNLWKLVVARDATELTRRCNKWTRNDATRWTFIIETASTRRIVSDKSEMEREHVVQAMEAMDEALEPSYCLHDTSLFR